MAGFVEALIGLGSGTAYSPDELMNLDPVDGRPVQMRLDTAALADRWPGRTWLRERRDLWRYGPLLPFDAGDPAEAEAIVGLGEGWTPLLEAHDEVDAEALAIRLFVKDEGMPHAGFGANPTQSFKDRGMTMTATMARHFGVSKVAVPTQGNAGDSLCRYARAAGMAVAVIMPDDTPRPILGNVAAEAQLDPGVSIDLVKGTIREAGERMKSHWVPQGYFNCATFQEPGWRIEGKKTLGLEIAEQLGWRLPDVIIYPPGGGTGILGMWKAFHELIALGAVEGPLPRICSVQSTVTAPLVAAMDSGADDTTPVAEPGFTMATGLNVPGGVGQFEVLRIIRESGGTAVSIGEDEMAAVMRDLWFRRHWWICPEGAACVAALKPLADRGMVKADDTVVVVNTGSLEKYLPELREYLVS
ncbi:MAG: threonine synthase [Pseudomonadota bacterium]